MKKNICVIFGGKSTEHDISVLTACQVMKALNEQKYNIVPVYINQNGKWFCGNELKDVAFYKKVNYKKLKEVTILPQDDFLYKKSFKTFKKHLKIDCAVVCCHGKNGEDGTVQGLLELANVPYTSSGVLASSVGLDKTAMKNMFKAGKIPICKYASVSKKQYAEGGIDFVLKQIDLPVIVKPNSLGSSIGISVAKTDEQLQQALDLAFVFDEYVVIEKLVEDMTEVNISVLGEGENCVCSVTEQPKNNDEFLTFKDKYLSGQKQKEGSKQYEIAKDTKQNGKLNDNDIKKQIDKLRGDVQHGNKLNGMQNLSRIVPANISVAQTEKIKKLAQKIFTLLNCKGVVRIDFMIDNKQGKIYANEINTIPGSFAFYLWEQSGVKFDVLLDKLIELAIHSKLKQNMLTTTFNTSVLNGLNMPNK